jgi:hypothetical protein
MSASHLFRAVYTFYDLFFASMFSPLENFNPKLSSRVIHTGSFEVKLSSQGTSACSTGLAQVSKGWMLKGWMLKHFRSPFLSEKFFKSRSLIKAVVVRTQYLYLRFMRQRTFVASSELELGNIKIWCFPEISNYVRNGCYNNQPAKS